MVNPEPIGCPQNENRKSCCNLLFGLKEDQTEINTDYMKNKTYFKNRYGFNH